MRNRRSAEVLLLGGALCTLAVLGAGVAIAGLIPGGGPSKSDCYAELSVEGIDNPSDRVQANKKVLITDGEAGDNGPCGDFKCTVSVGVCINQSDPNLADCVAPASLDKLKVNKAFNITVPQLLSGSVCGAFVDGEVSAKVKRKNGEVKSAKPGKKKIVINAKAAAGTKPRTDKDTVLIMCLPRTVECPSSPSAAFVD
jgi:hypothetical protein